MFAAQSVCEHSGSASTAVQMEGHTSMYACAALVCPVHRVLARDRISAPCLWRRVPRRCMLELRPVVSCHAQGCYRFTSQLFYVVLVQQVRAPTGQTSRWSKPKTSPRSWSCRKSGNPRSSWLVTMYACAALVGRTDTGWVVLMIRQGGAGAPLFKGQHHPAPPLRIIVAGAAWRLPCLRGSITPRPRGDH